MLLLVLQALVISLSDTEHNHPFTRCSGPTLAPHTAASLSHHMLPPHSYSRSHSSLCQALAFLAHLAEARGVWGPFLVVAPASTLHNWDKELSSFTPGFKASTAAAANLQHACSAARQRALRHVYVHPR